MAYETSRITRSSRDGGNGWNRTNTFSSSASRADYLHHIPKKLAGPEGLAPSRSVLETNPSARTSRTYGARGRSAPAPVPQSRDHALVETPLGREWPAIRSLVRGEDEGPPSPSLWRASFASAALGRRMVEQDGYAPSPPSRAGGTSAACCYWHYSPKVDTTAGLAPANLSFAGWTLGYSGTS